LNPNFTPEITADLIEYKRRIELESVVDNIKDIFRLTTEV
jgi:hypothetical protein